MPNRKPLSTFPTALRWLKQFREDDLPAAKALLDAMVLLNEEQVGAALRSHLYRLADERHICRKRIALYAERELDSPLAFTVERVRDGNRTRQRAVGYNGFPPVKPKRGSSRVGSEGPIASIISQVNETRRGSFMIHPGPDRIRGKTRPAGSICIVTDFIGSGSRVCKMLDAFWSVPSVRSWASRHWIDFQVISASATAVGVGQVASHRAHPKVHFEFAAPTVADYAKRDLAKKWQTLINNYGPDAGRGGVERQGFGGTSALIAFNYRLPNNTPALVHKSEGVWRAFFEGAAPDDLRSAFGVREPEEIALQAAQSTGTAIPDRLPPREYITLVVLTLLRGKWRPGTEVSIAERTGIAVPDVLETLKRAKIAGYIDPDFRLTDAGQSYLTAGTRIESKPPVVSTNEDPYYPQSLRTPREIT